MNIPNFTMPEDLSATVYRRDKYKGDAKEIESDLVLLTRKGVLSQRKVFSLNLANFGFYESSTGTRRFKLGEKEEMADDLRTSGYRLEKDSVDEFELVEISQENVSNLLGDRFYSSSGIFTYHTVSANQFFKDIPFHKLDWAIQDTIKRVMNESFPDKCLHYGDVMFLPIKPTELYCFVSLSDDETEGQILQFKCKAMNISETAVLCTGKLIGMERNISFPMLKRKFFEFSAVTLLMDMVSCEIPDACRGDVKEITNKLKDIGDGVMENGDWLQNSGDWKHICCADKTGDIYYGESLYMDDARAIFNCLLTQVEDYVATNL